MSDDEGVYMSDILDRLVHYDGIYLTTPWIVVPVTHIVGFTMEPEGESGVLVSAISHALGVSWPVLHLSNIPHDSHDFDMRLQIMEHMRALLRRRRIQSASWNMVPDEMPMYPPGEEPAAFYPAPHVTSAVPHTRASDEPSATSSRDDDTSSDASGAVDDEQSGEPEPKA